MAGGCRCCAARYTLAAERLPVVYACHCLNCQTMTGSAFVLQAPVPEARLSVNGTVTIWANETANGVTRHRFCASCLTRLYSTHDRRPGLALLRAGTLDRSNELSPALHIWVKRKQPWIAIDPAVPGFDEAAPPELPARLFAANHA